MDNLPKAVVLVDVGRDCQQACRGGHGQKMHHFGENVEESVETNRLMPQERMQERIVEEGIDISATQIQRESVKVIQLISQERISKRIV